MRKLSSLKKEQLYTGTDLNTEVQNIEAAFRAELNASDTSSNSCCLPFFNCLKKVKIPQEYLDVIKWLGQLATKSPSEQVMTSALIVSMDFVSKNTTGSQSAADALTTVIKAIATKFNIQLSTTPDYTELQKFCDNNQITIPDQIKQLMVTTAPAPTI